jgi:hypothetical protein
MSSPGPVVLASHIMTNDVSIIESGLDLRYRGSQTLSDVFSMSAMPPKDTATPSRSCRRDLASLLLRR